MNSFLIKALIVFLSLFAIIMAFSQIALNSQREPLTREASFITVSDTVDFNFFFVRDEIPLMSNMLIESSDAVSYLKENGSKIEKNGVVAEIYSSESDIINSQKLEELDEEIELLEKMINPGLEISAQPEFVLEQIEVSYSELHFSMEDGDFDKVEETKAELAFLFSVYNLLTNTEEDDAFSEKIASLELARIDLSSYISPPTDYVRSGAGGYYISYVDGYESVLTYENYQDLTYDEIVQIIDAEIVNNYDVVGKISDTYESKIVGIADTIASEIQSDNLKIQLENSTTTYPVTIDKSADVAGEKQCVLNLTLDFFNEEIARNRVVNGHLIYNEYSGIEVPRTAIRFKDGIRGVYILDEERVLFKKIDPIYEGEDFVISADNKDSNYLALYDQILLEEVEYYESTGQITEPVESDQSSAD